MEVKYDLPKYVASVRMSSKKRILVEGRDDKSHIKNLLDKKIDGHRIKVDTAENIKGDCKITAKNNRAKLEKIHDVCSTSEEHKNLYFLCDREFMDFNVSDKVEDLMPDHKTNGNLSWTIGHSFENYFIEQNLVSDAFRYLTSSEFKNDAAGLFEKYLPSTLKLIAISSLAAKEIEKSSYPLGVISWDDFEFDDENIFLDLDSWRAKESDAMTIAFKEAFRKYQPVIEATDFKVYARICRGHTAIKLLQRAFSACLYLAGRASDADLANKSAVDFSKFKESTISTALCESWLRAVDGGSDNYPINLVTLVA